MAVRNHATYPNIQARTRSHEGVYVKSCWIAHVKEMCGLPLDKAPNRHSPRKRAQPCPPDKVDVIKRAFRHFGMI